MKNSVTKNVFKEEELYKKTQTSTERVSTNFIGKNNNLNVTDKFKPEDRISVIDNDWNDHEIYKVENG